MAFTRVVIDTDELTAHLGKEQLDLFDTNCIAALYRDTDSPKRSRTDPEAVVSAASAKYLALAVESTFNLFTTTDELTYVCTAEVSEHGSILAMKWLAETGLLVIATNKANLLVYSVATQTFPYQLDLKGEWKSCALSDFYNKRTDSLALFVSPDNGVVFRFAFDAWQSSFVRASSSSETAGQLPTLFQAALGRMTQLNMGNAGFEKMTAVSYSEVVGCCLDGVYREVHQPQRNGGMRVKRKINDLVPTCIRAHLIANSKILAVLTKEGAIKFIDLLVSMEVESFIIPRSSSEVITDFAFIEWPGADAKYKKIALIVQKNDKTELQIREMSTLGAVAFTREVVHGSHLVQLDAPGGEAQRLVLIVEPADANLGYSDQSVCVRAVVETQLEQRLTRLINRGMLDEAERFALENKLDVQVVHSARAGQLLEQLSERPDDVRVFEAFLVAVDKVDDDMKSHCVQGAITPLKSAQWISRLLEYAEKSGVVDSQLASLAYNFATYRMVWGPNANYGAIWAEYQYEIDWVKQWIKLLKIGNISAARIIWQRYPMEMRNEMHEGVSCLEAIRATEEMLKEFPSQWRFAIDHLEADVMSLAVSECEDTDQIYKHFIDLLVYIAETEERTDPEAFPDNSLYAVSAVERLVNRLKKSALTPKRSAEFLYSSSNSVSEIEEMYKRSRDLRAIKRLKETYECPLSYEKYKKLSTKEICHEILQRSVQNPAQVRDRIDRIARPFMEEHSLPVDETLLGHIEKVTSIARCQTSSEPLDVHCLLVTEAINSVAVRSRAVLKIADAAPIPWCEKLVNAVKDVMGNARVEKKIKDELNLTKDRMRLAAICQDFGMDREYAESAIDTYADFAGLIRFLFTGSLTSTREITNEGRYDIAAEAVSIFDRLRPSVRPSYESPRVDQREYVCMLIEKDDLDSVHKFVEKHSVIDETIEMLVLREETAGYAFEGDADWQGRRTSSIVAINSLIQRHRRNDERWKEIYEEMRKMHSLVTKYDMDVSLVVLRTAAMRPKLLHKYMKKGERKLKECLDLSTALGLSHDDAFLALLDYSAPICPHKQARREDEVDVDSGLYLCRKALEHATTASTDLLKHVVHVAELALKSIIPRETMSVEDCARASDYADDLDEIIPHVLQLDVDMAVTDRALAMHRAVRLILETVLQMQQKQQTNGGMEEGGSGRNGMEEDVEVFSTTEMEKKQRDAEVDAKIVGYSNVPPLGLTNRRRVGAYDGSMDNPVMEMADTMRAVCSVAFLGLERPDCKKGGENAVRRLEEMEDKWHELFGELSLQSQNMLEMHARVLYSVWGGRTEQQVLLPLAEGQFAERLLQQHPCDLPLLATIFATLEDDKCMAAIGKLVRFASKEERKSPQTMLNVCRLAQLMLSRKDTLQLLQATNAPNGDVMQTPANRETPAPEIAKWKTLIRDRFTRAMWEKKLAKKKMVAYSDAVKAVREFAAHMLQPEIVREYLYGLPPIKLPWDHHAAREFTTDRHAGLIALGMAAYLTALLTNAVNAKDEFEREGYLVTADNTIELEVSQSAHDGKKLREFLCDTLIDHLERECCPYAHEVIQFILAKLISLGGSSDERWKNGKKVADFICLIPRAFSISAEERAWYTDRRTRKNIEMGAMDESVMPNEENFAQMPEKASTRLPFHLLLRTSEVDLAKYVVPLVWHEITLPNLVDWYNLLRDVHSLSSIADLRSEKLNLKRNKLVTKAVMKYIRTAMEQNDQLSEGDMEWIQERLYAEKNVYTLLQAFALETMQVAPQGNTRIQLMQLGYNVTKKYLNEQPESAPDRAKVKDQQERLRESLREMNTKRLLQSHKIYNQDTSPYVKDVDKLISRIYDRFINWDEPTDVEQKCALIKELAETNEHNLEQTHSDIVQSWLCGERGADGDEALPDVDMNDTMGSIPGDFGGGSDRTAGDEEDWLPIPFYDEEVTRIVHVVRLTKNKQRLVQSLILNFVNMTDPPGGLSTHIRAVCTLLRACNADELAAWAPEGIDDYAGRLDGRLSRRLVERTLGAAAYSQFAKIFENENVHHEKLALFIRNLLLGPQRSRPGANWLATVLTMDHYEPKMTLDQKLIDHMLSKLNSERKYGLLAAFLKFCSYTEVFRNTRNLNVLWGRTIESAMKELEDDSTAVSTVHEWLLFALACPTPGNQALESLSRAMEKRGATIAVHLIKLASSYTKTPLAPSPSAWQNPKRVDYPVQWEVTREEEDEMEKMDTTSF